MPYEYINEPGRYQFIDDEPKKKSAFGTPSDLMAGALRGAGSIGATLLSPIDYAAKKLGISNDFIGRDDRRSAMDSALQTLGADPQSWAYAGGKLGGEIAGTAGIGGVLAAPLKFAPRLAQSIASAGFSTSSKVAPGLGNWAADTGIRAAGGAITGAGMAGMIDPNDAKTGAFVGAALPVALQLAGKVGNTVYNAVKSGKPGSGKLLADALGVSEDELQNIITKAQAAPESLIPGSNLTLSQALQQQGANLPQVKMLERIVSGGPGGDALLNRYADQGTARLDALRNQGARTYQGAPRAEATTTGDLLGNVLRTQEGDERAAQSALWKSLTDRATNEGVALQLPLKDMQGAMNPLGRGSVGMGADARSLMNEANNIGTVELPGIEQTAKGKTQSLEQAVRAMGGIRPTKDYLVGELRDLTNRESGTTGLVSKMGRSIDDVSANMFERGFIPENDPAILLEILRGGGGRNVFARDITEESLQRPFEAAMGDLPGAERIPQAVPFDQFQRLRSSAGELAAKAGNAGNRTEAGVLNSIKGMLEGRVNDATAGNLLPGEVMPQGFNAQYGAARDATRKWYERYGGGNNIESILRKPAGQDYTLSGDQITNKLWHGGSGLARDVSNLKNVLGQDHPALGSLQDFIMTDAASKTKASGDLGAALPRYVETRMPGLLEALNPDQLKAITGVAGDIRNADAASAVQGLLGSDTQAKIARSLDAGLLDSSMAKTLGKVLSIKGIGLDTLRSKAAESVIKYKGKTLADLLANPKVAAAALNDARFVNATDPKTIQALYLSVSRSAPAVENQMRQLETQ